MKSKMSFFDPTLLKKNISRFAPAWAILLLGMFLAFPMTLFRSLEHVQFSARKEVAIQHLKSLTDPGVIFALFSALLFAVLVFNYLHKTNAAYMLHAFPMTRTCLFVTNLVSGLLFYLVPALLTALSCLGVLTIRGIHGCDGLVWRMLLHWILQYLFFYGLAVFTMHLSGRTVISVLSYAALNFICLLIPVLILILMSCYFFGFDFEIPTSMARLAPVVGMLLREHSSEENLLPLTALYAAIGLALTVLAWVHYRFRQVERAGDAMAYPWARIAFRLIFTLCCALGLGWILAAFFDLVSSDGTVFLPWALLGCFLGWFGSTMMLERTVKVFKNRKIWLGFAAFAGVLILFVAALKYDLLGVQRRVPETARVESVEIWTDSSRVGSTDRITLTSPEQIDVIRGIHSRAVDERDTVDLQDSLYFRYSYSDVHIEYHLKNGTTLRRIYEIKEEKDWKALAALFSDPEIAAAWYDKFLPQRILGARINSGKDVPMGIDENGNEYYGFEPETLECRNLSALRGALLADAAAGRLPVLNAFTTDWESATFQNMEILINKSDPYGDYWTSFELPDTATETLKLFEP